VPRPRTISDEAILEALTRVVSRDGPAQLTVAAVASEAGIAPATLIQRFGSRRAMLLALHEHDASRMRRRLQVPADHPGSIIQALIDNLVALSHPLADPVSFSNHLAVLHQDLSDPAFHARAQTYARAMREEIHLALQAAVAAGELLADDLEQLARSIQTVYNGTLITWAIDRDGPLELSLRRELEAAIVRLTTRPTPGGSRRWDF
jgi:AcrR family transcriptional regulator